jgi:hypothetical protein
MGALTRILVGLSLLDKSIHASCCLHNQCLLITRSNLIVLQDSNAAREKEVLVNEIDTLGYVLDHLNNLKYDDKIRAVEIIATNNDLVSRFS